MILLNIEKPGKYNYTLSTGRYYIQVWGAQGGTSLENGQYTTSGGKGAYASGFLTLNKRTQFYLYVGGKGFDGINETNIKADGGFNGGGKGGADLKDYDASGGGGGSSDIRYICCDNEESIESRFIVAGGGSGSSFNSYGAPAGILNGFIKTGKGENQIAESKPLTSKFHGEDGVDHLNVPSSGSGGGYFGGYNVEGQSSSSNSYLATSSSGSSYVSGYPHLQIISKYILDQPTIYAGNERFIQPSGEMKIGKEGDGHIRISSLSQINSCKSYYTFRNFSLTHSLFFIFVGTYM